MPIGLVQRVMGHEQASTTLNRYTHTPDDYAARVLAAFEGSAASLLLRRWRHRRETTWTTTGRACDLRRSAHGAKGRPPSGGDGGRLVVRLRGGRAEPTQRLRGVQPPRPIDAGYANSRREDKHAAVNPYTSSVVHSTQS
ncbi:hypothetical protein ACGFKZ_27060 [Micromonospora tulbaghiae]|uniref:hypothetical protein n=1 Tax=Micromonospora tulbaghiae TaxID=479978 RepID=UPI00371E107B